jgi:hypothetical protein
VVAASFCSSRVVVRGQSRFRSDGLSSPFSSFPRKREPSHRAARRLPLGPRFREDGELPCSNVSKSALVAALVIRCFDTPRSWRSCVRAARVRNFEIRHRNFAKDARLAAARKSAPIANTVSRSRSFRIRPASSRVAPKVKSLVDFMISRSKTDIDSGLVPIPPGPLSSDHGRATAAQRAKRIRSERPGAVAQQVRAAREPCRRD